MKKKKDNATSKGKKGASAASGGYTATLEGVTWQQRTQGVSTVMTEGRPDIKKVMGQFREGPQDQDNTGETLGSAGRS